MWDCDPDARVGALKRKCKFYNVLYVSELTYNLSSVSKAVDKGSALLSVRVNV